MKKKTSKRKRLAEGIYDQNGRIVIAYRKNGKLIWNSPGLPVSRPNIQKAIERRAELKYSDKERVIKVDIPLNAYAEKYLQRKRREVAKTTYSKYSFRVKHITDYFGDMQVRKITPQRAEEFYDQLFTEHQLIPDTVREIRRQFNQIMDMAVEDMIVSVNPIKKSKIDKTLADQYSVKKDMGKTFFSCKETVEFLKCCENHELHDFFYLMYFYALRREEALGIRIKASINLEKETLSINHTVTDAGGEVVRQDTVKRESSEDIFPLLGPEKEIVKKIIDNKKKNKELFGKNYKENDYLFTWPDGEPYKPNYVSRAFKKIIRKNPQLPQDITLEGLRSSCASNLVEMDENIKTIQAWMRHKDIETTLDIYAKIKGLKEKTELANSLNHLFDEKD